MVFVSEAAVLVVVQEKELYGAGWTEDVLNSYPSPLINISTSAGRQISDNERKKQFGWQQNKIHETMPLLV